MFLRRLTLQNFRNITEASLDFPPGAQLLIGRNGQGKTSLLEAVYFAATATTPRTRSTRELIRKGETSAFVEAEFQPGASGGPDRPSTVGVGFDGTTRRFRIDGVQLSRSSDLYGRLRAVFFSPEDIDFLSSGPRLRRRVLDLGMCQKHPRAIRRLIEYRRILKQRNFALRGSANRSRELVRIWDPQLAGLGSEIGSSRGRYALALLERARVHYSELVGEGEPLSGSYRSSAIGASWRELSAVPDAKDLEAVFLERLEKEFDRDLALGRTQIGPHRDDLSFEVSARSAARYASQGQRRSIALALKLAERDLLMEDGDSPILLVDDVIHEMDFSRRANFLRKVSLEAQSLLTFTESAGAGALVEEATVWRVERGGFHREGG